jgi:hypothetical protein
LYLGRGIALAIPGDNSPRGAEMPPERIMLIRHAEKPDDDGQVRGVDPLGRQDADALSVHGWQRAGALVRLFAPHDAQSAVPGLATPDVLCATRATPANPSQRSIQTLVPLAEWLRLGIRCEFGKGDEAGMAAGLLAMSGVVLVAWSHEGLPALARALGAVDPAPPKEWPKERFDLVWVFTRQGSRWAMRQVPQWLLAGDSARPL